GNFAYVFPRQALNPAPYAISGAGWQGDSAHSIYHLPSNVGIRTSQPGYPLDVYGEGHFAYDSNLQNDDGALFVGRIDNPFDYVYMGYNAAGYGYLQSYGNGNVKPFVINPIAGKVGIGTTSPATTLEIDGPNMS